MYRGLRPGSLRHRLPAPSTRVGQRSTASTLKARLSGVPRISYLERFARFVAEVAAGDSDGQLIALLGRPGLDYLERITVTAPLGESGTGPEGASTVRAQFDDAMAGLAAPNSARHWLTDLACTAVIALARRDGPAATDVYLAATRSSARNGREYGLMVLGAEGDDRAREPMIARVGEILSRKRISYGLWYELLGAVCYLARHAAPGTAGAEQLVALLRANWGPLARPPRKRIGRGPYVEPEMETAERLEGLWPGIQPYGPPAAALGLPGQQTPIAWWSPGFRPPSRPSDKLPVGRLRPGILHTPSPAS